MLRKNKILIIAGCALALVAGAAFAVYMYTRPNIPNEKTMARLMADMYATDAALQDYLNRTSNDRTVEQAYHTVLEHYGLTKAEYDTAMAYYARNPKLFTAVYDRTIAILAEKEAGLSTAAMAIDSIQADIKAQNDSLTHDIGSWPVLLRLPITEKTDTMRRHLKPKAKEYDRIEFELPLDSLRGGRLTFFEKYTISGKREKADSALVFVKVAYADTTTVTDSAAIDIKRLMYQRDVTIVTQLRDSVAATRVTLIPMSFKGMSDATVTLKDIRLYHKQYDVIDTLSDDIKLPSLFTF